jgi:hypothetical protein
MADPIIQLLLQQQLEQSHDNPFVNGANSIDGIQIAPDKRFGAGDYIAAQALKGLASGLLGSYGKRELNDSRVQSYQDLAEALKSGDFSKSGELANLGAVLELDKAQESAKNRMAIELLKEKTKYSPPEMQNFVEGTEQVQKQWDPSTQTFKEIGRGPRWGFAASGTGNNQTIADLLPSLGLSGEDEDSARTAILAAGSPREARMLLNSIQKQSIEKERRENRPITPEQTTKLAAMKDFNNLIAEASQYAELIGDNRLKRVAKSKLDSNSPEFKLDGVMSAAQQAFARARDSGALSRNDIEIYNKLFGDYGVLDSRQSLIERIAKAKERASQSYLNNLSTMDKAGFNISEFMPSDEDKPFTITLNPKQASNLPSTFNSEDELKNGVRKLAGVIDDTDSEQAYKEAYKAKLRAQRGE